MIFSKSLIQKTKLSQVFLNNSFVFILYSVWFWFFSLIQLGILPQVWPDEILFFSPSENLFKTGHLSTTVLSGLIPGMDQKTLWMPPVFMIVQSALFFLFPVSLETIRLFAVSLSFSAAVLVYAILKEFRFSKLACLIGFLSLLTEVLFFRFGNSARMEGITAFFFLACIFTLLKWQSDSVYSYSMAGFLFSFSVLSHPFALGFGLTIFWLGFIFFPFRWKNLICFTFAFLIPVFGWLLYMNPDWNLFIVQFGAQLIRKKTLFSSFSLLTKLNIFLFGFGWIKARAVWLIFFFAGLLYLVSKERIKDFKNVTGNKLLFLGIWLFTLLFALFTSTEGYYVYHFMFPMAMGLAILVDSKYTKIALASLVISLGANFHFVYIHWIQHNTEIIWKTQTERLKTVLTSQKKVYLQALPDPYFSLRTDLPNLELLEFIPGELEFPSEEYKTTLALQDAFVVYDFHRLNPVIASIVNDTSVWEKLEWEIPVSKEHWYHYRTIVFRRNVSN